MSLSGRLGRVWAVAFHRAQRWRRSRPSSTVPQPDPEQLQDWRAFSRAFLKLKAERDDLRNQNVRLSWELEQANMYLTAARSRIASLAEENGEGAW